MDSKVSKLEGGVKDENNKESRQNGKVELAESIGELKDVNKNNTNERDDLESQPEAGKTEDADSKVEKSENTQSAEESKDRTVDSVSAQRYVQVESVKSSSQSTGRKSGNVESLKQSSNTKNTESIGRAKAEKSARGNTSGADNSPKRKKRTNNNSKVAKLKGKLRSFGETMNKLWDVWSTFKTKDAKNPNPSESEKTLGVPGFEEIACIEAEVPDIMMMDKDKVRTSCKECMRDPPAFPTTEQIKAKLIAADKYYDVRSAKSKRQQADLTLEHEADYYDTDGRVVRPSWRFILERPLVEQYVLMTNYIRKVSVLSELKDGKTSEKFIEEQDSGSDTEYKKFEQKFIKEKRELLKPIQKPKTLDMAVQTSYEPKQQSSEDLKESVSEISLYPESEESTNSPEASAVTIVTSRDYTSPLQSDFDGRTTDKSTSYRGGNWWECQAPCEPSESFQTSLESINKNTSSGSDGQSVPIHSAWGKTTLQPAKFSGESDPQVASHSLSIEPLVHKKSKDSKKVSFSPVVTYYQGPSKNAALYNLPKDEDISMETEKVESQQQDLETWNPKQNPTTANHLAEMNPAPDQITVDTSENKISERPLEDQMPEETNKSKKELQTSRGAGRPKPSRRKASLGKILQEKKSGQLVSVSMPADWHEGRILHSKNAINVAVSRTPTASQPVTKKISFPEFNEIPDLEYSDPQVSTVQDRADANIQTQTSVAQKNSLAECFTPMKISTVPLSTQPYGIQSPRNLRQSKLQLSDDPPTAEIHDSRGFVNPRTLGARIPKDEINLSERLGNERTESMATYVQTATPPSTKTEPRYETLSTAEQRFDGHRTIPPFLDQASKSGATQRRNNSLKNDAAQLPSIYLPRKEHSANHQIHMDGTQQRTAKNENISLNANPDDKLNSVRISKISRHLPLSLDLPSKQQHSTDTDGPSSSSNEHIKLKASPPCFFKVATPTDLSKISVDEFYPDVPEIDAELSQISETRTSSAPQVEIVFASKESAWRYIQDSELRRFTRKEENTILQKSLCTSENDSATTLNAPNKRRTIIASAGVGIKIDERIIEKSKDNKQDKSGNTVEGKAQTKNSSQQSNITQNVRKMSSFGQQSRIEPKEEPTVIKHTVAKLCETDLESSAMTQEKMLNNEVNQSIKVEEVKTTKTQVAEYISKTLAQPLLDEEETSRQEIKLQVTVIPASITPLAQDHLNAISEVNETSSQRNTPKEKSKIEKASVKCQHSDKDDEKLTIQQQQESFPEETEKQLLPQERTKLFVRTLPSLAEESSSVVESTSSSTQDKIIDMPVMARSVEELKTIFEKMLDVSSVSGESELREEIHSDLSKCLVLSKEKRDNEGPLGELVSVETITATDDATKDVVSQWMHQSDGKFIKEPSSERNHNLTNPAVKVEVFNAISNEHAKYGLVNAVKTVKSDNHLGGREKNTIQEESGIQQLSQIDVIRASEIYSNTSMHVSSSEDREVKLTKARTGFLPVTLYDDLPSTTSCGKTATASNGTISGPKNSHLGSSTNLELEEKFSKNSNSGSQNNSDSKPNEQSIKYKSNHEDSSAVGQGLHQTPADDTKRKLGKENSSIEEATQNAQQPSTKSTKHSGIETNQLNDHTAKAESKEDDTSSPSETKQWLMDVIPVLSKTPRFHGLKPRRPICVKEANEAEAVKYRQDAVKPVFKFLKRQREMKDNKE